MGITYNNIGRARRLFKRQTFTPGIYYSELFRRADESSSLCFRLEIFNLDYNITGTDGKVTIFVQTVPSSSLEYSWKVIYAEEFDKEETFEKILTLNMDVCRFKILIEDSTVELKLHSSTNMSQGGGNSAVTQINLPEKLLAGNEQSLVHDFKAVYTTGPGSTKVIDKLYIFPRGSVSGDPTKILSFSYDSDDDVIDINKDEGVLP